MIKRGKETPSDNRETQKDREGLEKVGGGERERERDRERERERETDRQTDRHRERGRCLDIANQIQSLERITKSL